MFEETQWFLSVKMRDFRSSGVAVHAISYVSTYLSVRGIPFVLLDLDGRTDSLSRNVDTCQSALRNVPEERGYHLLLKLFLLKTV